MEFPERVWFKRAELSNGESSMTIEMPLTPHRDQICKRVLKYWNRLTNAMFKKKDKKSPKGGKSPKDNKKKSPTPSTTSSDPPLTPNTPSSSSKTKKDGKSRSPRPSPSDPSASKNPSGSNTSKKGDESAISPSPRPSMAPLTPSMSNDPSESRTSSTGSLGKRLRKRSFPSFNLTAASGRGSASSDRNTPRVAMSPSPVSVAGSPPSGKSPISGRSTPGGVMSPSLSNLANLTAVDYGRRPSTSGRNAPRDPLPPPGFAKPVPRSAGRGKLTSSGTTPQGVVSPSLTRVADGPSSHATSISDPSTPRGLVFPSPSRSFSPQGRGTPTSSRGPRAVNTPTRVVSRTSSSPSLTTSAARTTTTTNLAKSLAGLIFDPSQEAVFDEYEEIVMERPKTPERAKSPPLLLSVVPSEDNLDPDAPPPKFFTVAEFLNTILEKNIKLPNEDAPEPVKVGNFKVEVAGVKGSNVKLPKSFSTGVSNDALMMAMEEAMKEKKAKEQAAKEKRSGPKQQDMGYVHPNGKPYSVAEIILVKKKERDDAERARSPSGRKRFNVKKFNYNDDGTPMTKEQIEASWKKTERDIKSGAVKLPKIEDRSVPPINWTTEDWQTPVLGAETVKRMNERKMKDPKMQAALARIKAKEEKKWAEEVAKAKEAAKAALENPTPQTFLDMPANVMKRIMRELLMVGPEEEVVPHHYVAGKIIKNADGGRGGLRTKPQVDILVTLCGTKDKKVRMALDAGRNVLYRENQFAFRKPAELILFMNTIGWINIARMNFDKNFIVSANFLTKYTHCLEVKWLARWQAELRFSMQGHELITPDWKAEDIDPEYEPPEIEKALKTMVKVMDESKEMDKMISASHMSPRIKTLDLGDSFSSIANLLQDMGMGEVSKGEVEHSMSEIAEVYEEVFRSGSGPKDTGKGKGKIVPMESEAEHPKIDWNDWKLDKASGGRNYFESFLDADNGDAFSEDSGYNTEEATEVVNENVDLDQGDLYGVSDEEEEEEEDEDGEEDDTDGSVTSENRRLEEEIKELL